MTVVTTAAATEKQALPHEVKSFLKALHRAAKNLIDGEASLGETEEMYAVFCEEGVSYATAFLLVGLARYAAQFRFSAREEERRILLSVEGKRRVGGKTLSYRDLLPEREDCQRRLEDAMRKNKMSFFLTEEEKGVSLTISLPRFLTASYDVFSTDETEMMERFLRAMFLLAGEEPKNAE